METAEQYAAVLPARLLKCTQCPAEVARISHRPVQRDEEALERGKIIALVVVHIVDIDIADLVLDRFDEGSFVCIRTVRHRTVETPAGDARKRGEPLTFLCECASGESYDRRRIEATAQKRAYRMKAAHLAPNGAVEPLTQPFRIGAVGLQPDRSNVIDCPVSL